MIHPLLPKNSMNVYMGGCEIFLKYSWRHEKNIELLFRLIYTLYIFYITAFFNWLSKLLCEENYSEIENFEKEKFSSYQKSSCIKIIFLIYLSFQSWRHLRLTKLKSFSINFSFRLKLFELRCQEWKIFILQLSCNR